MIYHLDMEPDNKRTVLRRRILALLCLPLLGLILELCIGFNVLKGFIGKSCSSC